MTPFGLRVRHGGLMRCCLATVRERVTDAGDMLIPMQAGDRLLCMYCSAPMRLAADGVWEWAQ